VASVDVFASDDVFQAGEFGDWQWGLGDGGHFWGVAAVPAYANVTFCGITQTSFTTDNSLNVTTQFTVRFVTASAPGGIFNAKAIRAA
jgi:hypothetical protein